MRAEQQRKAAGVVQPLLDGRPRGVKIQAEGDVRIQPPLREQFVDLVEQDDVPVCRGLFAAVFALTLVVAVVRQPDVQEVDVVLLFGVVRHGAHDAPPPLGVGQARVRVEQHAGERLAFAADLGDEGLHIVRNDDLLHVPAVAVQTEGVDRPAVAHVVILQAALLDLALALALPLQDRVVRDRLRRKMRVGGVLIVEVVVKRRDVEFQHEHVHAELRQIVDDVQIVPLRRRALVALAAVAQVGHLVVALRLHLAQGDGLAVHAREQPAAAVQLQKTVHRQQHAARVGARDDLPVLIRLQMDDVVQPRVLRLGRGQAEVLQQPQPEAAHGVRIIADGDRAAARHHHPQVFLQLLGGKIHRGGARQLEDLIHGAVLSST